MVYLLIFCFRLSSTELIVLVVSPISHYVSGPRVRFALLAFVAPVETNSNMSKSLCHLCDHPCNHCVHFITYLQLDVIHCGKIDSVQTQLTQGKKCIVGARFYTYLICTPCLVTSSYKGLLLFT